MAQSFVQRHFRCNPEQQATQDRSANRGRGAVGQSSGAQGRPSVFTPRRPNAERRREAGKERAGMRVCRPGIRPAPRGSLRPPTGPQRRQPASRTDPAPRRKPGPRMRATDCRCGKTATAAVIPCRVADQADAKIRPSFFPGRRDRTRQPRCRRYRPGGRLAGTAGAAVFRASKEIPSPPAVVFREIMNSARVAAPLGLKLETQVAPEYSPSPWNSPYCGTVL